MKDKFFSCNGDGEYETHSTQAEAEAAAKIYIDERRNHARLEGEWSAYDSSQEIYWGKIVQQAKFKNFEDGTADLFLENISY